MKLKHFLPLALGLIVFLMPSCLRDDCKSTRTYIRFDPVYKTIAEMRQGLVVEAARPLQHPGKITSIGNYLLINEFQTGIHVIDNADPSNPVNLAFWNIPGNVDMAVRNGYLYADQYIDLLSLDISDMQHPVMACRTENMFQLFGVDPTRGTLVDYLQTEVTEDIPCTDSRFGNVWFMEGDVLFAANDFVKQQFESGGGNNVLTNMGINGSYSRFGMYDQYLYCVDNSSLVSLSLASPACPQLLERLPIGWNIETVFPWKDRLFVGSQTGVQIFNNSNPAHPVYESGFSHANGCDPVVCDENNAYVTVHDGTTCNGTFNQLDVIDIKGLPATTLLRSYPMTRPQGLSVTDKYVFLCDDGLKILDKADPTNLKELSHVSGIDAYDIIALSNEHLMLIGADGFYQFDVTNPAAPKQISHIAVSK